MSTLPEKAIKGNRKAMIALYESNKEAVYNRACELLGDGGEALVYVFKNVWNDISKKKAFSEEKFAALALEKSKKALPRIRKRLKAVWKKRMPRL